MRYSFKSETGLDNPRIASKRLAKDNLATTLGTNQEITQHQQKNNAKIKKKEPMKDLTEATKIQTWNNNLAGTKKKNLRGISTRTQTMHKPGKGKLKRRSTQNREQST